MMTDIERMKAELEAEGYSFRVEETQFVMVCKTPNGFHFTESGLGNPKMERAIAKAYDHLQEQRKLKALEALYQLNEELFSYAEMYMEDGSYPRRNRSDDSSADITYGALRRIYSELLKVRNITADDESDDDESI